MQSFSDFTERLIELSDNQMEQLDEINFKRVVTPAAALAFTFDTLSELKYSPYTPFILKIVASTSRTCVLHFETYV